MDLIALLQIAFRRWKILLPLLLLFGGIGTVALLNVPLSYEVNGAVRVTYPFARTLDEAGRLQRNPYYDTEGTAAVISLVALSPDVETAVEATGATAKFATNYQGRSVIAITTTDLDKQNTLRTYRALINELGARLDRIQEQKRIPRSYWVALDDIVEPKEAATSATGRVKVGMAAGVLGLTLSVGICLIVDYRSRSSAARKASDLSGSGSSPEPVVYRLTADDQELPLADKPQEGTDTEDKRNADDTDPYLGARLGTSPLPISEANGSKASSPHPGAT